MSADGYQRVIRIIEDRAPLAGDQYLRDDEHGPLKVVPADAIVIERGAGLPEVIADRQVVSGPFARSTHDSAESVRREVRHLLAIAEFLDTNPPVDEAAVAELVVVMLGEGPHNAHMVRTAEDAARRAVAAGWTKGDPS